ncbi:P-loop containing nucleoside triphosphate hydrolase [Pseudocohnilembus persalinus]|uniref:p-loop containing nucleoside triphosphate hydrolase n=1 Tax=Pseudocohnilembus persalinus TaxID=266149 RepID=A0A0V0QKL6_PSEPJ|nr:P-loop containing nucleoside triphosphate hydrolase [Pseudocohnilembus persalinus]|eukprot:KRX02819.1 P-loop containing nucleoside triphosphate hydrolase [Pseudocohnilembus persalinus]
MTKKRNKYFKNVKSEEEQGHIGDMTDMECLNEAELLYNLQKRYKNQKIYTYVGPTLIAMNPFVMIDGMYSEETIEKYKQLLISNEQNDSNLLSPPVTSRQ